MSNINRLLNIYFIPRDMIHLGQDLVKPVIHEKLANLKHELKTLTIETLQSKASIGYEQEEVYSLFFSGFETDKNQLIWLFNSKKILRRLSYIIGFKPQKKASILDDSETLLVALNLFKSNWSSQYLLGLIDNCLEHFLHPNIEILRQFILSILQNPQSEQDKIWSKYQNLTLSSKGPVNLAYYLLKENIALKKGNGAIGLGNHIKSYVYYQEVAKAYIHLAILKNQWEDKLEPTLYFLRDQKQPELSKQILTPIILAIEDMPQNLHRENIQKKMHSLISELIGDPDKDHLWKPWNSASEEDIKNINLAREAVKNWIKQLFIELFFNEIAQDADRRRMDFWRKKLKFIENFKIFGQDPDFNKLNRHPLIRPRLWEHWGTLEGDSHQSVFVMEVDDYILIEFGKTGGAFYAVKKGKPYSPFIRHAQIRVTKFRPEILRSRILWPSQNSFDEPQEEGTLRHSSNWEERLELWFEKFILRLRP